MGSTTTDQAGDMGAAEGTDILTNLFISLEGSWQLERRLNSVNASEPSGRCHGVARFKHRPTSKVDGDIHGRSDVIGEMLYHEEGRFQMQAPSLGAQVPYMTFARNYIWRIDSPPSGATQPAISLWFAKPGTQELDYLFHPLIIDSCTPDPHKAILKGHRAILQARGSHLCVEDQYETDYTFTFTHYEDTSMLSLAQWQTVHTVKGPKKDQRIETTFTRHERGA